MAPARYTSTTRAAEQQAEEAKPMNGSWVRGVVLGVVVGLWAWAGKASGWVAPPVETTARVDFLGDPLPAGAVARLGTLRMRLPFPRTPAWMKFTRDGKQLIVSVPGAVAYW